MEYIMIPFMLMCLVAFIFIVYLIIKIGVEVNMSKLFAGIVYVALLVCTCIYMGETTGDITLAYYMGCYMISSLGFLLLLILNKVVDIYEKINDKKY